MDDKKVNTEERKSDEAKTPVNTEDHATAVVITITGPKEGDHPKKSRLNESNKSKATKTGDLGEKETKTN